MLQLQSLIPQPAQPSNMPYSSKDPRGYVPALAKSQGAGPNMPTGTDTMHFIKHTALPHDCKPTYLCIILAKKPHKTEVEHVRFTVGGNLIDYPGVVSTTPTTDLTTAKILFNSVVSTPNAMIMTTEIKDL
jgi:hypothetical protein